MIQALVLMFEGKAAWVRIVKAEQAFSGVFWLRLMPMMAITTVLEGLGLARWGKWQPYFNCYKRFSGRQVLAYEAGQFALNLLMIVAGAFMVRALGRTFHGRKTYTYTRSFTAVVCSLSPMFLLRLFDPFPDMNPYVTWGIGIVLSVWILYDGLPRLLAPDPTHSFGLFISSAIVLVLATCSVRMVTAMFLQGSEGFAHTFIGRRLLEAIGQ